MIPYAASRESAKAGAHAVVRYLRARAETNLAARSIMPDQALRSRLDADAMGCLRLAADIEAVVIEGVLTPEDSS